MSDQRKPRRPKRKAATSEERKARQPEELIKDLPVSEEEAVRVKGGKAIIQNIPR